MSWQQALFLGLLQGITEFLPISSSAHLALAPVWLGWHIAQPAAFIFDVLVQVATLAAVVGYYRGPLRRIVLALVRDMTRYRRIRSADARLGLLLGLATLPGVIAGLVWKDAVARAFQQPRQVAFFLLGTAMLLALAELLGKRVRTLYGLHGWEALLIGAFQALALFPGISRSGATMAAGMFRHLTREDAAHFSFLMAVPIMMGAGTIALWDLFHLPSAHLRALVGPYLIGFLAAGLSGYGAIHGLLKFLHRRSLWAFAVYCTLVAGLTLYFFS